MDIEWKEIAGEIERAVLDKFKGDEAGDGGGREERVMV